MIVVLLFRRVLNTVLFPHPIHQNVRNDLCCNSRLLCRVIAFAQSGQVFMVMYLVCSKLRPMDVQPVRNLALGNKSLFNRRGVAAVPYNENLCKLLHSPACYATLVCWMAVSTASDFRIQSYCRLFRPIVHSGSGLPLCC
jgi:hypothetical protein